MYNCQVLCIIIYNYIIHVYPNMAKLQSSHKFYKSDTKPTCVPLRH